MATTMQDADEQDDRVRLEDLVLGPERHGALLTLPATSAGAGRRALRRSRDRIVIQMFQAMISAPSEEQGAAQRANDVEGMHRLDASR